MSKVITTIFLFFIPVLSLAQAISDKGINRHSLLKDVIDKAKRYSVYSSKVDWPALETEILPKKDSFLSVTEFTKGVKRIFQALGDKHGGLNFQGKTIRLIDGSAVEVRPDLINPFRGKPAKLSTSILESGYGYILVPGTAKYDSKTNQQFQDSLCSLGLENLEGLVIDLRLNEGGSIHPMFTGFNQLFRSKTIGYTYNIEGNPTSKLSVKNGSFYFGKHKTASVYNKCNPKKSLKIVVLTSQITASSGEMLAVAFKGRDKTLFMGEKTSGYITMVTPFKMGDGYLALSTSFIADRNGTIYDAPIQPDVEIIEGDNFGNLGEDAKVRAALQWLKKGKQQ
jgi:carboxyl-terminal processing protease